MSNCGDQERFDPASEARSPLDSGLAEESKPEGAVFDPTWFNQRYPLVCRTGKPPVILEEAGWQDDSWPVDPEDVSAVLQWLDWAARRLELQRQRTWDWLNVSDPTDVVRDAYMLANLLRARPGWESLPTMPNASFKVFEAAQELRRIASAVAKLAAPKANSETRESPPMASEAPAIRKPASTLLSAEEHDEQTARKILNVFTGGLVDKRLSGVSAVIGSQQLTVDQKLWKIDALIPIPPTTSAQGLATMLDVTKAAVLKTEWWRTKRRGEKRSQIGRREEKHRERRAELDHRELRDDDDR